ncbi:hypothetical protein BDR26DRAFT_893664 [Obelidium mucronatum]|nr:hypothetical protein BDR26DRAFT_893664 [Obelidium mucronatum]
MSSIRAAGSFPPLSRLQLDQYLRRINLDASLVLNRPPSLEVANFFTKHHTKTVPFENLALLFQGTPGSIDPDTIFEQLVTNKRGGYCYQNTILIVGALQALGFKAATGLARMIKWDETKKDYIMGPLIHMIGLIEIETAEGTGIHLLDVGRHRLQHILDIEGGSTLTNYADETYQIRKEDVYVPNSYTLYQKRAPWAELADGVDPNSDLFQPQFSFSLEKYRPADFEIFNHFVVTKHILTSTLFVNIATETGGCASILGNAFRRREDAEHRFLDQKVDIQCVDELVSILESEFGLKMTEGELEAAKKNYQ